MSNQDLGYAYAPSGCLAIVPNPNDAPDGQVAQTLDGQYVLVTGPGGSFPFTVLDPSVAAITLSAQADYVATNSALVTFTLPSTMVAGSVFRVAGFGTGGWKIAQLNNQEIFFGNQHTTVGVGGSLASSNAKDCVEIVCVVANTTFLVLSSIGNITFV